MFLILNFIPKCLLYSYRGSMKVVLCPIPNKYNYPFFNSKMRRPQKENRFVDKFEKTLKMSTYVVGFLVSDFGFEESDVINGTEFRGEFLFVCYLVIQGVSKVTVYLANK